MALAHLFTVWLWSRLGPLAWGVFGLVWILAVASTVLVTMALSLRRELAWAGMALAAGVLGAATVAAVDWNYAWVHAYYRLNRADFQAVTELARSGELRTDGSNFPAGSRHLALNGQPVTQGGVHDETRFVWLPAWTHLYDGATGFAYIGDPEVGSAVDCLSNPCVVRWSLGDGWSWVEMPGWAMS